MQGYMNRDQWKPQRYPLEVDVARGDQVEFEPLVSDVPPFPIVPESTAGTPRDPPVGAANVASFADPISVVAEEALAGVAIVAPSTEPSSIEAEESLLEIASV